MSKCTLTVGRRLRRVLGPGETELGSAGTQPNEGYLGRGCAKVHPAAGGGTSPAAVFIDGKAWTPALCLKKMVLQGISWFVDRRLGNRRRERDHQSTSLSRISRHPAATVWRLGADPGAEIGSEKLKISAPAPISAPGRALGSHRCVALSSPQVTPNVRMYPSDTRPAPGSARKR